MVSIAVFADYLGRVNYPLIASARDEIAAARELRSMIERYDAENVVGPFDYVASERDELVWKFVPRGWPTR